MKRRQRMGKDGLFRIKNAFLLAALFSNLVGVCVVLFLSSLKMPMELLRTSALFQKTHVWFAPFAFFIPLVLTLVYEKPVRRFLNQCFEDGALKCAPPLLVKQRLLNEPFFQIALSLSIWIFAALLHAIMFRALEAGPDVVKSAFFLSLHTGLITVCIEFFLLEFILQRRLAVHFFPDGNLSMVPKTIRISIRKRLLAMVYACNLVPFFSVILSLQSSSEAATAGLAELRTSLFIMSVLFMAAGIWLTVLVSSNLTKPLREIIRVLGEVRRGNFDARVEVTSSDELGYTGDMINAMNEGLKERDFVKETFGKYVSSEIRDEILSGGVNLEGELKEVTVLFADLRNFTPLVERTPPRAVVKIINKYFERMEAAIHAHQGLVLQYIGDEIEAVFGAPLPVAEHPKQAVKAALAMREALGELNSDVGEAGWPPLAHGIGIHTGEALAASIGSPNRLSYALVGDTVNLASRLQGLNKQYGTDIIVSETTCSRAGEAFSFKALPHSRIKGKHQPIDIYSLD